MNVHQGITIRIKPTAGQRAKLEQHFGCNRFLYNYFLNKRRTEYQTSKQGSTYYRDAAELTKLKRLTEFSWMYEASVASQQRTLRNLDTAYKRFFKGIARFPRFKSKRHEQAFTVAGGISVKGKRVCLPKFSEGLKFNRGLPSFEKINNATVKKTASGAYYILLCVTTSVERKVATGRQAGIDLGLKDFAVFSNGKRIKAPKLFRQKAAALKRAQQHLSRKKEGSKRREKQRIKVARIQERIANARKDFHHKASSFAVQNFDMIAVEDLAVKNMLRNRRLAKSISDAGWSHFIGMLEYKSTWYGRKLVKIGRFFPSSKTCGECGHICDSLPLDVREWQCPACGEQLDRDLNASRNILREGIKQLSERSFPSTVAEAA